MDKCLADIASEEQRCHRDFLALLRSEGYNPALGLAPPLLDRADRLRLDYERRLRMLPDEGVDLGEMC